MELYLPEQVVRILHATVKIDSHWLTINHDKLCKYKDLSEEKQEIQKKFNTEDVMLRFMHV